MLGKLYVVGTPIGNLDDLTFRAKRILNEVSLIAAEDTRVSQKLLKYYKIKNKLVSYHDYNEVRQSIKLIEMIKEGIDIAIISDAGTPCISDPGYRIVNLAQKENIKVISIPGPSSIIAALSISGVPTDRFYFEGFLPPKKGRKTRFELLATLPVTIVIFESPHKLIKTLNEINDYWGGRIISICREITKVYEETFFGTILDSIDYYENSKPRGEFVLLVAKKGYSIN